MKKLFRRASEERLVKITYYQIDNSSIRDWARKWAFWKITVGRRLLPRRF